jgi:hypothetical protein
VDRRGGAAADPLQPRRALRAGQDPAFRFAWCPSTGTGCVDESKTDASLIPKRDATGGYLYGRIKHFSGYTVVVDRADDGGF